MPIQETAWSRVLDKLTGFQPVKNLPALHGTRRSITARLRNILKIYFIHLGHEDIYCILIHAASSSYFPQNSVYFIILSFSVQVICSP
jgi:hypothetical protein